ncbi:MAG: DUF1893 domain-containing protein [Spirochaetales bacterium]|nr:DUF1893 domain-containing protein [Spirochaetales bacterium]
MTPSLIVTRGEETVFSHTGSWLHPLFALEEYLRETHLNPEELFLQDKIVGKAAAFLIVGMGFKKIKALTLSLPGKDVLDAAEAEYTYDNLVDRIQCRTERMLAEARDPSEARAMIDDLLKGSKPT